MTATLTEQRTFVHGGRPSIRGTFTDGFRLLMRYPRHVMGPLFVVQLPVSALVALATALLYFTALDDREVIPATIVPLEGDNTQRLVLTILSAVEALFALVAIAATVIAVGAAAQHQPMRLVEALDPAFTRLGSLILLVLVLNAGMFLLVVSVIGIPVLIYLAIRLAFTYQAFMLEGLGVRGALRQSWVVTTRNVLRTAGLVLLAATALLPALMVGAMLAVIEPTGRNAEIVTTAALSILTSVIVIPMAAAIVSMMTIFYLNLKAQPNDVTAA